MPNILVIEYNRFINNDNLQEYVNCNTYVNLNNTCYNLKAVIVHNGHHSNKMFNLENIQNNSYKKILINQAYILLLEGTTHASSQDISSRH